MRFKFLDSRLAFVDPSLRETMYLLPAGSAHENPVAIPVITMTGNPVRVPVTLKPYDLTYDRFVLRLFVGQSDVAQIDPTVLINGSTYTPESSGDMRFRGSEDTYRMLTITIPLHSREAVDFIDRPIDVHVEFPPGVARQVLVSNRLSDQPYSSRLHRYTVINRRQLIYVSQYLFLLMAGSLLVLVPDYNLFNFPAAVSAPLLPILLFLFGDYLNRDYLRAFSTRHIFRLLLKHPYLPVLLLLVSLGIAILLADRVRCEWTKYRYQAALREFVNASGSRDDPSGKLANLVSIAPERKENLFLFQHLLWTSRHDDAVYARVDNEIPEGFARSKVAIEFRKLLDPDIRAALERGDSPKCGCVEDLVADDPRILWISVLEESMGTITKRTMEILAEIIRYLEQVIDAGGESVNPEFRVLLHRYQIVYYSHMPEGENVAYEGAMAELQKYVDVLDNVRLSIFEIAVDQLADSSFLGYCDTERGLQQYRRVFDIRRYNNRAGIMREFPPQKLTAFRLVQLLKGESDYFNEQLEESLQLECGPNGETLEHLFRAEFFEQIPPAGVSTDEWILGTPADPRFLQILAVQASEGWKK